MICYESDGSVVVSNTTTDCNVDTDNIVKFSQLRRHDTSQVQTKCNAKCSRLACPCSNPTFDFFTFSCPCLLRYGGDIV